MNDRKLGYILLFVLGALITGFTTYFVWVHLFPTERWTIRFDRIGNLNIEDPVTIHGLQIGRVEEIEYAGNAVFVQIRTTEPLKLHEDYKLSVVDKGLMGERTILIDRGTRSLQPITSRDTLHGVFAPGVSEALDNTLMLKKAVVELKGAIQRAHLGTDSSVSFVTRFVDLLHAVDSISVRAVTMSAELDKNIAAGIDSVRHAMSSLAEFSRQLDTTLPDFLTTANDLLTNIDSATVVLESTVTKLASFQAKLETQNQKFPASTLADLQQQLRSIRDAIESLRSEGLPLPVRIER